MPIVRLDSFREDVRQFLKNGAVIQTKISMDYIMNRAPEIATIWPKVVEYNEKYFKFNVHRLGQVQRRAQFSVLGNGGRQLLQLAVFDSAQ